MTKLALQRPALKKDNTCVLSGFSAFTTNHAAYFQSFSEQKLKFQIYAFLQLVQAAIVLIFISVPYESQLVDIWNFWVMRSIMMSFIAAWYYGLRADWFEKKK